MQRNYHEVLEAMRQSPIEANGLHWFGVGLGEGAQILHPRYGSSGGICSAAVAYLCRKVPTGGFDLGMSPLSFPRYLVMDGVAIITFFPDDSYEAAMTLIGQALKQLLFIEAHEDGRE